MISPLQMPGEKVRMLTEIADRLLHVPNIVAVVLGGSYARGLAGPGSDLDVGLYYREASPFSIDQVRSVAASICTAGSVPIVVGLYEWGPWVNGGAWIQTPVGKVDFLYKNLDQIQKVMPKESKACGVKTAISNRPMAFAASYIPVRVTSAFHSMTAKAKSRG